jgi:hypothetical protein
MAELYVFLVKETDQVLNALYTGTVVDKVRPSPSHFLPIPALFRLCPRTPRCRTNTPNLIWFLCSSSLLFLKDLREFDQLGTPGAALDDETESPTQRLTRLGNQVMPPHSIPCVVLL